MWRSTVKSTRRRPGKTQVFPIHCVRAPKHFHQTQGSRGLMRPKCPQFFMTFLSILQHPSNSTSGHSRFSLFLSWPSYVLKLSALSSWNAQSLSSPSPLPSHSSPGKLLVILQDLSSSEKLTLISLLPAAHTQAKWSLLPLSLLHRVFSSLCSLARSSKYPTGNCLL